jgi:hypothetical protein
VVEAEGCCSGFDAMALVDHLLDGTFEPSATNGEVPFEA